MKTPTPRNVVTKLDDLGLYSDLVRRDGESTTNFRSRLLQAQTLKGGTDARRLTDAICAELGLGQTYLMLVQATLPDVELEVTEALVRVMLSGVIQREVELISSDVDGYWTFLTVSGVVSGLQGTSGILVGAVSGYENLPAFLIEPQSSRIEVVNEQVPRIQSFDLGILGTGDRVSGPVYTDRVSFNDAQTYQSQVTGVPLGEGQWSVDISGRVRTYTVPTDIVLATYQYSILGSGMTMGLVANGARILNLASEEVQDKLFTVSGIGATARDFLFEIRSVDRNFWGR